MNNPLAFSGGAFDPPHLAHLAIAEQVITDGLAQRVHMGPSGVRVDKASYHVSNNHRRRMLEIMMEENPDLRELIIPDFDFIDAPRETSAAWGVDRHFREKYKASPKQVFGTDVIPHMGEWLHPDWVQKEASKIFVPRGTEPVDYTNLENYTIMSFRGHDMLQGLSSTRIRAGIPAGDFTGLSEGVAEYIRKRGLYLPPKSTNTVSMHTGEAVARALPHTKCRTERPDTYPERFQLGDEEVNWDVLCDKYDPPFFEDEKLEQKRTMTGAAGNMPDAPHGYLEKAFHTYTGLPIQKDTEGRPLNPHGRTGITGRGELYFWGANFAADPLVTRKNPETGQLELLTVFRTDAHKWALPGGMVDAGESGSRAAMRELGEEAGIAKNDVREYFENAPIIYHGYVDDWRNTDHAWMETTAVHVHLSDQDAGKIQPKADGIETADTWWMPLTEENMGQLYASHGAIVRRMIHTSPDLPRAEIITAPMDIPEESPSPRIFLAGSIEQNTAIDWQKQALEQLEKNTCMIFNPRRKAWDVTWSQEDNPELTRQINWELDALEKSDIVLFYFDPNTRSPVTLLEFGFVRNKSQKVHVCCPPGFWRRTNVLVTGTRLGYIFHDTLEEMLGSIDFKKIL